MGADFPAIAAAGSLRASVQPDVTFDHQWTDAGVAVEVTFTGAHLLHLSIAACVLNDLYREAAAREIVLNGVRVTATGGFDTPSWQSTGIQYTVEVDSDTEQRAIDDLIAVVDDIAEIPRAVRATAPVTRVR